MIFRDRQSAVQESPDSEDLAAATFAHRNLGQGVTPWNAADELDLKTRLEQDPAFADAYRRVEQSWASVGKHATSAELMALREQAISRARRASVRRWSSGGVERFRVPRAAAAIAAVTIVLAAAYQFAPFGFRPGEYRTRVAEQRSIELPDHSRVALDADTRLRVRFSKESRIVQLLQGQAQFSVAKDSARPFKVEAGDHTVVAVGTVFTVEYVDRAMHVAMLEGKVAVLSSHLRSEAIASPANALGMSAGGTGAADSNSSRGTGEAGAAQRGMRPSDEGSREPKAWNGEVLLTAGEALHVVHGGPTVVTPKADLEAATAWREGKVIFRSEQLGQAIRRLNRYSRLQLQVDDPRLASMNISGVFDAGDTAAFVEAVRSYLPVTADYPDSDTIRLRMK